MYQYLIVFTLVLEIIVKTSRKREWTDSKKDACPHVGIGFFSCPPSGVDEKHKIELQIIISSLGRASL